MRTRSVCVALTLALLAISTVNAEDQTPKRILNPNRTYTYLKLPPRVTSLSEWLTKGMWYGRLRAHGFRWNWHEETRTRKDNWSLGIGGSMTLKTAYFYGLGATIDAYTSQNPWHMSKDEIVFLKGGKDTLSRHDVYADDRYDMNVIAQLYAEYKMGKSNLKYGRQKFESILVKSNDSKMIPNTFEGVTLISKDLPKHTFKLAWFTKQKLRNHTTFHEPLTYGDRSFSGLSGRDKLLAIWSGNDDSAMHRGLSYDNYRKAGLSTDHDLLVFETISKAAKNLKGIVDYTAVPDVLSSLVLEFNYKIPVTSEYTLIPGVRGLEQFDNGGGKVGGASLTGLIGPYGKYSGQSGGYDDPDSLRGWAAMGRIDLQKKGAPWRLRAAYSQVGDEADIVAPWRGFPTGGYTRSMGQYNWLANTKSWMFRADYDFSDAGLIPGFSVVSQIIFEDFDQGKYVDMGSGKKLYLQPSDRTIYHFDLTQKFAKLPGFEMRLRVSFVDADKIDGVSQSYEAMRFEMNYLF